MPDDEFLARIDAHMERGNVLIAEVREEVRLTREALVDNRTFAQQMIMRVDRTIRDSAETMDRMGGTIDRMGGTIDRMGERMDRMGERMDRGTAELERIGAEQREENRAGREALFAMIDRMNKLDPPDASG